MIISEMNVKLTATTSAFARKMDKAGDKITWLGGKTKKISAGMGKFGSALGGVGGKLKALAKGALAAAAAVAGIAWGAKKVFDLGASIEETGSKFRTVFGPEASAEVSAFLDNFAAKVGLTVSEAKGMVATTGAIAQGMGFSQKASADFATEITKLAGDMGSFNNVPTAEVIHAINSALTGEREQLKQLSVIIQEADVQAKAFAQTGKTVAKNLTQQEKATATLALITEKAGVAVGDLDRTSGSAANVAKRLTSRFKEMRDAIATALMPAFGEILTQLENNEQKFIDFKDKILENSGVISAWAMVFVEAVKFIGLYIMGIITNLQNVGEMFVNVADMAKAAGRLDWAGVKAEWDEIKANREAMKEVDRQLEEQAARMGAAFKLAFSGGMEAAKDFQNTLETISWADVWGSRGGGEGEEDTPIAPIIAAVETLEDKLKNLSENFSKNFVNRMTDAAQGGKDVFKGYFEYMKKQLVALAVRALLFKLIMGVATKFDLDLGGFAKSMTGFEPATSGGGGLPAGTIPAPTDITRTTLEASRGGAPMVVNQNINFSMSAIDGQSAAAFIRSQGGAIADVIATAAKDSTSYRRQLQGA